MVRAKVRCESLEGNAVKFATVYESDASKDTENARFTKATPWGEIRLGIDNPAALEQFEVGKEYYVDFHAAPGASAQGDGDPSGTPAAGDVTE